MDAREPFESTTSALARRLSGLAIPVTVAALAAIGVVWIAGADRGDIGATAVFLFLMAIVGGMAAALVVYLSNGTFGAADDQPLAIHRGWFRYQPGRSGAVGALAIVGLMVTAFLRAPWMGPPMLVCLALGALASPLIFVAQRKRAARCLPPSIR